MTSRTYEVLPEQTVDSIRKLLEGCSGTADIPRKGDLIFYIPSAHAFQFDGDRDLLTSIVASLPSKTHCRVSDVELKKDGNDVLVELKLSLPTTASLEYFQPPIVSPDPTHILYKIISQTELDGLSFPLDKEDDEKFFSGYVMGFTLLNAIDIIDRKVHPFEYLRKPAGESSVLIGLNRYSKDKNAVKGDVFMFIRHGENFYIGLNHEPQKFKDATLDQVSVDSRLKEVSVATVQYKPRLGQCAVTEPKFVQACTPQKWTVGSEVAFRFGVVNGVNKSFTGHLTEVIARDKDDEWELLQVKWDDATFTRTLFFPWEVQLIETGDGGESSALKRKFAEIEGSSNSATVGRSGLSVRVMESNPQAIVTTETPDDLQLVSGTLAITPQAIVTIEAPEGLAITPVDIGPLEKKWWSDLLKNHANLDHDIRKIDQSYPGMIPAVRPREVDEVDEVDLKHAFFDIVDVTEDLKDLEKKNNEGMMTAVVEKKIAQLEKQISKLKESGFHVDEIEKIWKKLEEKHYDLRLTASKEKLQNFVKETEEEIAMLAAKKKAAKEKLKTFVKETEEEIAMLTAKKKN